MAAAIRSSTSSTTRPRPAGPLGRAPFSMRVTTSRMMSGSSARVAPMKGFSGVASMISLSTGTSTVITSDCMWP